MAPKAREDLVIPYKHVPAKPRKDTGSNVISQSLPMAAMFMRNKMLAWAALFLTIQSYLQEPINQPEVSDGSQPASLKILFSLISVITCYMDIIFPSSNPQLKKPAPK